MKHELATIYRQVSAGELSQQEALERIKALKRPVPGSTVDTLLASAVWEPAARPVVPHSGATAYAQHRVLLYDLPQVAVAGLESQVRGSRCEVIRTTSSASTAQTYDTVALAYFEAVRSVLQEQSEDPCLVQLVVADRDHAEIFAGLAGLIETAALENPGIIGQILFVRPDIAADDLAECVRSEREDPRDRVVRYTGEDRLARRWRFIDEAPSAGENQCVFKEHGVYLITGGLGGLGVLLANEILAKASRARIVLTGRAAPAGDRLAALESLQQTGRVEYRQVDVGDASRVERLIESVIEDYGQLNGIVHSAGVLRDDFILKKSSGQFTDVLQPKVAGTEHLDFASRAVDLDFFVLFSSIASWAGNLGQADYAAANGFMEQFAGYRNARVADGERRGRTLAIAWPHWLEGGMNIDAGSLAQLEKRTGLRSLETAEGMRVLHYSLTSPQSHVMVMRGDTGEMRRALEADPAPRSPIPPAAKESPATTAKLETSDLPGKTREFLRKEFAEVLKIPDHRIETHAPLENYGIDSIRAMNLTNQLEATFGALAKTLFFEYQTIDELAAYFVRAHADTLNGLFAMTEATTQVEPENPAATAPKQPPARPRRDAGRRRRRRFMSESTGEQAQPPANEPIAIVGLSGRYPEARDLEAFWKNLSEGEDCIVEVPKERWDWRQYYSEDRTKEGAHFSKWGGFIEGVDEFDPRFFKIAPREAPTIDPQERLFLQHAWMAVEDAGYTRASLQMPDDKGLAGQAGVYAGVMYGEYNLSGTLASIANRVSYFLNVHGPSLTLDTMCSSSLTAIHLACQDLRSGRTHLGIAGGVNVTIHPNKYTMLSGGQFISSDGHCQSFGEGGDGYIPGEGVGVAVLKRLSDAERDGNHIYGVIRGSALNHGGKTNGYTVPNPQAQAEVVKRALEEARIDPRQINYIEAHGTGTELGDPIEISALTRAFEEGASSASQAPGFCRIGSAKSNIGHCESAAGIAGVTKVLLQMKHRKVVPSLHSQTLNPHIDFDATPFVVNQELREWEPPELDGRRLPRTAGISSFGAGGSNAHLIIEEYPAPERTVAGVTEPVIVPLSARTADQLEQRARDLLAFIERSERRIDLAAMAYTLQVGREAMDERAAVLTDSVEDLAVKLTAFLNGGKAGGTIHRARVKQHREAVAAFTADPDSRDTIDRWINERNLGELADLWVKGLDLEWRRLIDSGAAPRLMSLPAYPFARERYWIEPAAVAPASAQSAKALHPLVHENTSDLRRQRYASTFTGTEAFLEEGAAGKSLPPLLGLEMVRAAAELALPQWPESGLWELQQTVWGEPLAVSNDYKVGIALLPSDDETVDVEIYTDTGDVDRDPVHCQSRAVFSHRPAPDRVDLAQLKATLQWQPDTLHEAIPRVYLGEGQALAQLHLSGADQEPAGYLLQPRLLELIGRLLDRVAGQASLPVSLERVRIAFAAPANAFIWLRHTASGSVDVDVCDEQGLICVQMTGMRFEPFERSAPNAPAETPAVSVSSPAGVPAAAEPAAAVSAPRAGAPVPREIVLAPTSTDEPAPAFGPVPSKPTGVRLQSGVEVPPAPAVAKATVTLPPLTASPAPPVPANGGSSTVRLFDLGEGVFSIEIHATLGTALEPLLQALNRVRAEASLKVLLLAGRSASTWHGDRNVCNAAIEQRLFETVAAFPCPVIAVLQEDATGAGLLLAAVSDFMVCSDDGHYGFTDSDSGLFPSAAEDALFRERLGEVLADDFLYRSTGCTGGQLKTKGWACRIVPPAQVDDDARQFAADLAKKPQGALGLLKAHLSRHLAPWVEELTAVESVQAAPRPDADAVNSALVLRLGADRATYDLQALTADLEAAFKRAADTAEYHSVVLASALPGFLPQTEEEIDPAAVMALRDRVRNCPVPVIAAFESDAEGLAWLFGLFCDAVVYSRSGNYVASALWTDPELARDVTALCAQRLGPSLGQQICLTQGRYSGAALQDRSGALAVVDAAEVMPAAMRLAAFWVAWPRKTVAAWKQAQVAHLQRLTGALPEVAAGAAVFGPASVSTPTPIELRSNAVTATAHPDGVVVVEMHDRDAKNMFSEALVDGLKEAFAHIEDTSAYKAVVLTGYDSYFATGGTVETLLAIQEGQAQFTDEKVFQLPMDCPLPVVAAIQGHGIGGGWSFGMFADLVLLSEESRYLSPYMGYGFTPGAGSTLIFPAKIGYDLARETLLSAQEVSGRDLKQRGIVLPVLPRSETVATAVNLAAAMARQPRERLVECKRLWTHALRQSREDAYDRELEMHEQTFVHNADTLATIQTEFSNEPAPPRAPAAPAAQPTTAIADKLRSMLAEELLLEPEEIDEDTQFIDLGLDSITGVTWVRKINEHYGTAIEATKVYSNPTLTQLSRLVADEAAIDTAPAAGAPAEPAATPVATASPATQGEGLASIIDRLKTMLAKELHLGPEEIEENVQFIDLGLDSITGVTWVRNINEHYGTDIEATKVYSNPTLEELAPLVKQEAEKAGTLSEPAPAPETAPEQTEHAERASMPSAPGARQMLTSIRRQTRMASRTAPQAKTVGGGSQPVAVVGIAGQFPQARNLDEFWSNLAEGRHCVGELSDGRWHPEDYFQPGAPTPGKTYSKWLGALDEFDQFDPLFFNISPTEAECMDPQQRVFLQNCWHSIENAGYSPRSLSDSACGVFVGCGPSDYHQGSREQRLSAQGFTGAATSILAARAAYVLNLHGPCVSIDTACSSSLVAIANACDSLNTGNSDLALAGGVYVMGGPDMHVMTSQAGMLSADGRCYTFDQRANGFVPGEGVGVLMLKRLADAERDGDRIQAVLEGWGVNQDGKTNGITAPNEESQTRLLQSVYRRFDIDPAGIQLIEAHGTGTKLGDPIEVAGLKSAFKPFTDKAGYCALGSVKSNIGHCLTAAGAAGIIKLILALKHRALPPTINYERRNEHIQLDDSPFYINDSLKPWDVADGGKRRAAVSSFGFSGTNAHLVVAEHQASEQARPEVTAVTQHGKVMIPLSARTESQLRQKAQDLLVHIRECDEPPDLLDVAYTLQVGREAMGERLGLLAGSPDELISKLEAFVAGETDIEDVYRDQVKSHKEGMKFISQDDEMRATIVEKYIGQRKLAKLMDLWVKGLDLDWSQLYGQAKPRRIELPGYPFARERYWIGDAGQRSAEAFPAGILHPLLHKNVSLLSRQRYVSTFSGEEFFVDAELNGTRFIPGLALLEMARAAVGDATADLELPAVIELGELNWAQPLLIAGETEVAIDLVVNDDDSIGFEIGTYPAGNHGVVAQGIASLREPAAPVSHDLQALWNSFSGEGPEPGALYEQLRESDLGFGAALRGVKAIRCSGGAALAQISLPGTLDHYQSDYVLHPSLIEAGVQVGMALAGREDVAPRQPLQPVAVDSLTVVAPCETEMFAWVRKVDAGQRNDGCEAFDIDLLSAQGECCVLIRGLVLGPVGRGETAIEQPELAMATPVWDVIRTFDDTETDRGQRIVVIGADRTKQAVLEQYFTDCELAFVEIGADDKVDEIVARLDGIDVDRLVWIASAHEVRTLTEESIIGDQNRGIMQVLRIARALTELGYEQWNLAWDLITFNTVAVTPTDAPNPTHAGLHGFVGSMAEVYPRWKIRLLDLETLSDTTVAQLWKPPFGAKGPCYALRGSEWYAQKLVSVKQVADGPSPYRHGGVYVVIGGNGGLGEIWTRHVIERYGAKVVWIGRRPLDETIRHKLDALSAFGERPEYIQADACRRDELETAYARIKAMYPAIHGVVHTAVGAFDQSLKTVSEDDFRAILSVKIDLSVRIAQIFGAETLDLMLFFSSNASFVRGGGMSGYAAGNCFKDAFARALGSCRSGLVKVVNWGYWSVGAGEALTDAMKDYFHQTGYRPLEIDEGMSALDRFMASDFDQLSITKRMPSAPAALEVDGEWIAAYDAGPARVDSRSILAGVEELPLPKKFQSVKSKPGEEMEPMLRRLLQCIILETPDILPAYQRWLAESREIVKQETGADRPLEELWREWDSLMKKWRQDEGKRALCHLVDRCVRALPDILTGRQKATDVLFPNSSLDLVEEVYKSDTISLAFNEGLRDTLVAAVQARLAVEPDAQIRLLEVGAGTGATTVGILDRLEPYQDRIAEYCYTDISKAFLFHAEEHYAARAPYLRTRIFDCERPVAEQGIEVDQYDFVIAANVIHATKNIRNVLRNTKAVLRKDGMLLMNEISDKSVCGHLTFGLLEGWWLNEDDEIRIPGSPGLYPEGWKSVLETEGFHSVRFPCRDAHRFGQQIVLAVSDGVVRQVQSVPAPVEHPKALAAPKPVSTSAPEPVAAVEPTRPAPQTKHVASDATNDDALLLEKTVNFCKQVIGKALKIGSDQIDAGESLEYYGIDSIVIGLVNEELQKYIGDVSSTLLYEFQTVQALAEHLVETRRPTLERLFQLDRPAPAATDPAAEQRNVAPSRDSGSRLSLNVRAKHKVAARRSQDNDRRPIAIIGISGRYPHASSLDEFWENLKAGEDCITEIPESRWPLDGFYEPDEDRAVEQNKSYCKWGAFLEGFAEFDPLFFGIPPREALNMDPQERLFMQASWSALENAGYTRSGLKQACDGRVGVFPGITRVGYNLYRMTAASEEKFRPRTSFSSVANRLSYFLDIHGPSQPVDTMCSSSLTAIHEACEHIHNGDCDLAIAGGVNLYVHPSSYIDMSSQHMLSKDGRCKSFGEGGNGFVPGEGVGAVLLKPLDRAEKDGDIIHGVVRATHVNHGGKTNGFTVPNPVAQAELVRSALDKAGINAREISYIEAHGTGTELGDPIEITGLQQAFRKDTEQTGYCKIGSAKSNIGHLEAAAGIAGLTKVVLQLKHQQIAPSLHAESVNPHIKFDRTPFEISQALAPWQQPVVDGQVKPRMAGVSSFGAGGANAHVIVQEYQFASTKTAVGAQDNIGPVIVPLSAKTPEQLQQKAADLLDFLRRPDGDADLGSIAYTLQIGREAMEVRAGVVVSSVEQLARALRAYIDGEEAIEGFYSGLAQRNNDGVSRFVQDDDVGEAIDRWIARKKYSKLAELWVKGGEFDWNRLYGETKPRRIELPTYPFATDVYWVDSVSADRPAGERDTFACNAEAIGDPGMIEDVITRVDEASIEEDQAVQLLKQLV